MKGRKHINWFNKNRKEIEVRTVQIRKLVSQIEFFMNSCNVNIQDYIKENKS